MNSAAQTYFHIRANRDIPREQVNARVEPYHSHPHHELLLVTSGDLIAVTPHLYLAHRGPCLLLYRAQRPHTQINRPGVLYDRYYLDFYPEFVGMPPAAAPLFAPDAPEDACLIPLSSRTAQQLGTAVRLLRELCGGRPQPGADERVRLLAGYVLSEAAHQGRHRAAAPRREEAQYLSAVAQYISLHLAEKLTIDRLAAQFRVGRTKLTSDFEAYLSMTVNQYITTERINRARELLNAGKSVDQTAESCGFSDSGYFIRVFRRYEQVTPFQYKQRASAEEENREPPQTPVR